MIRRLFANRHSVRAQARVLRMTPRPGATTSGERTYNVTLLVQSHRFDPFEASTTVKVPAHKLLKTGQEVTVRVGRSDRKVEIVLNELMNAGLGGR